MVTLNRKGATSVGLGVFDKSRERVFIRFGVCPLLEQVADLLYVKTHNGQDIVLSVELHIPRETEGVPSQIPMSILSPDRKCAEK